MPDEKARGITIQAAAITLRLGLAKETVAALQVQKELESSHSQENEITQPNGGYYVGNLPRDVPEQEMVDFLVQRGVANVKIQRFNARRGYAIVSCSLEPRVVLALHGKKWKGRNLVVEDVGSDPVSRLSSICRLHRIDMPQLVADQDVPGDAPLYSAGASWASMGNVLIRPSGSFHSKKDARRAAAEECLRFWDQQQTDFDGSPTVAEQKSEATLTVKESAAQPQCSDTYMVLNLIDCPGHIEFNAEVSAALRVSDGALLVVDAVEGKAVQTETVLMQALREGVRPVLMINKVDRLFLELQLNAAKAFDKIQTVIDQVNRFIAAHQLPDFPDQRVSLRDGSVCWGSGYYGWACSIDTFLQERYSGNEGDTNTNDFSERRRSFLAKRENFVKHILRPIVRMHHACGLLPWVEKDCTTTDNSSTLTPIARASELLEKIPGLKHVKLVKADEEPSLISSKDLLKRAMMAWLPAADALTQAIALYVPSPRRAQLLRAPLLYDGNLEDEVGQGIVNCDAKAAVVVYVSKMASAGSKDKRLLAFGRVFAGTVRSGDCLRALRTDGTESRAKVGRIKIYGIEGAKTSVDTAIAGDMIALEGIEGALNKAGTLTSSTNGMGIRHMTMAVTPTLQHAIRPKDKRSLTKMVTELRRIVNSDTTALFYRDKETEEYILAGAGGLHIEVLVSSLLQASGIEVELSDPIIAYREVVESVSEAVLAKSDNKHNRIYVKASPLPDALVNYLSANVGLVSNPKALSHVLVQKFGWDSSEASKIWAVGPVPLDGSDNGEQDQPTCLMVDSTFGLQIPADFRDNVMNAFQQVVRQGVLVHAPMRGVRFDIVDAKYHTDAPHRKPGAIVPMTARALRGAFLSASPHLAEPLYRVDITGSPNTLNGAFSIVGQRSGTIVDVDNTEHVDRIHALVPVRCATGMSDALRLATQGHADYSSCYGGMQLVPTQEEGEVIRRARRRKKMPEGVPEATHYTDRL